MTKPELTHAVLTAKAQKKLTWAAIAQAAGFGGLYHERVPRGEFTRDRGS